MTPTVYIAPKLPNIFRLSMMLMFLLPTGFHVKCFNCHFLPNNLEPPFSSLVRFRCTVWNLDIYEFM